jgi:cytochrome c peroxidase
MNFIKKIQLRLSGSITILFIILVVSSAYIIDSSAPQPDPISLNIPKGWPSPKTNIFSKNKLTEQGFQLGKKLFYDSRLSKDGEISCASCHQQFASFSHYDHNFSHGVNNTLTQRNAPALINLIWMNELHWDGGINHLEVQPLSPITASNEMGNSLDTVLQRLKKDSVYVRMFREAFGDDNINSQRMLKAIAQFTGSLISSNSKYDRVKNGQEVFTPYEARGYEIFKKNCSSCHTEPLFTDNSFRNNGLKANKNGDIGRISITNNKQDSLKFKVPTLRNTQLSFPYMHDGRLYTLYDVVEHYRTGIDTSMPSLDKKLKKSINISEMEKAELVYFLYTLTDSSFIKNPRFAPGMGYKLKRESH